MKKTLSIIGTLAVLSVISCSKDNLSPKVSGSVSPVFTATLEPATKAALNTEDRTIEWEAEDVITVVDANGTKAKYIATPYATEPTKATFTIMDGEPALGDGPYTAYYPSTIVNGIPNNFALYNDENNDIKNLPMAAVSDNTVLNFRNLCAVIRMALPAQSSYNLKSISIMSDTKILSGEFTIAEDGSAVLSSEGDHFHALNRANAKTMTDEQVYYMAIPAGEYDNLRIRVTNNAGGDQIFTLNSSVTLARNTIYSLTLNCSDFRTDLSRDYSTKDAETLYYNADVKTANSYHAQNKTGKYKFLPTKGEGGVLVEGIKSVKVLWEAQAGTTAPATGVVAKNAAYNKGYIEFDAGGSQGNALIAAYDGEDGTGNILWSWHIWRANTAFSDVTYPHGEIMMDRNIGAFGNSANSSNSIGVYFQYGRKDPFTGRGGNNVFAAQNGVQRTVVDQTVDVETSIKNPTVLYINSTTKTNWCSELDKATWAGENKTIYDPCPYGYRVPALSVWTTDGTTIDADNFTDWANNGTTYSGQNYVATGQLTLTTGAMNSGTSIVFMWSRELNSSGNAIILDIRSNGTKHFTGCARSNCLGLRCQKIE